MSGKNTTVYDQDTENGCVAISGMGYYVPLDSFVKLEVENSGLKESLRKEKSRNAFIEVTGKSLAEIRADAINEMVFELTKNQSELTLSDVEKYADKLIKNK